MELKDKNKSIEINLTQGSIKATYPDENNRWCFAEVYENGVFIKDPIGWISFLKDFLNNSATSGAVYMNENRQSLLEIVGINENPRVAFKLHYEHYDWDNRPPIPDKELVLLSHTQTQQLYSMLPKAIEGYFNEDYGKISYYHYNCTRELGRGDWCYRATDLEEKLKAVCIGNRIEHVFVNLDNYIESSSAPRVFDFDGEILLVLQHEVIQIGVLGDGIFSFQEISRKDIQFQQGYGYIPYNHIKSPEENRYVYDILNEFPQNVRGKLITTCKVYAESADCIGFTVDGFDMKKAEFYDEVPISVAIILSNNQRLLIYASQEYSGIDIEDLLK